LLLSYEARSAADTEGRWGDVVLRFQQFTGPLMAKGLEDTLMYGYLPLLSANEVGGAPDRLGVTAREFHRAARDLAKMHPRSMTTSSTHDTKRGEDTRLRIDAITHHLDEWTHGVRLWRRLHRDLRRRVTGSAAPDANDEYLVYQTIVGVLTGGAIVDEQTSERLREYLLKSLREAKRHTSWTNQNDAYEQAALDYLDGVLEGLRDERSDFAASLGGFLGTIDATHEVIALSHQVVRLTMPGVPDTYRGAELLDLTLVDPDNRRPVDWDLRIRLVSAGTPTDAGELGARKLALLKRLLHLRRDNPHLFLEGEYVPLHVVGDEPESLVAYARTRGTDIAIIVARRTAGALSSSSRLQLPYELSEGEYEEILTGTPVSVEDATIDLSALLTAEPAAVLRRR
ncbi:MAG: malto-oligosyltrehalose synthase, partial [Spirochaetota bacterium]